MLPDGTIMTGPDPAVGFDVLYVKGRVGFGVGEQVNLGAAAGFEVPDLHSVDCFVSDEGEILVPSFDEGVGFGEGL